MARLPPRALLALLIVGPICALVTMDLANYIFRGASNFALPYPSTRRLFEVLIFGPIWETLVFQTLVIEAYRSARIRLSYLPWLGGILFSAVLFAEAHVVFGSPGFGRVNTILAGLALALIYLLVSTARGWLMASLITAFTHSFWNFAVVAYQYALFTLVLVPQGIVATVGVTMPTGIDTNGLPTYPMVAFVESRAEEYCAKDRSLVQINGIPHSICVERLTNPNPECIMQILDTFPDRLYSEEEASRHVAQYISCLIDDVNELNRYRDSWLYRLWHAP